MDKYRYNHTISPEELRLSSIDVRKEIERQGKHELAELLLSSLESMEFGKVYVVGFAKEEEADWRTGGTTLQLTAYFKECETQEVQRNGENEDVQRKILDGRQPRTF